MWRDPKGRSQSVHFERKHDRPNNVERLHQIRHLHSCQKERPVEGHQRGLHFRTECAEILTVDVQTHTTPSPPALCCQSVSKLSPERRWAGHYSHSFDPHTARSPRSQQGRAEEMRKEAAERKERARGPRKRRGTKGVKGSV